MWTFMEPSLGKIEKVDLREVWNHEALDFTKWLAKKENLLLLGGEIGIDILQGARSIDSLNFKNLLEKEGYEEIKDYADMIELNK